MLEGAKSIGAGAATIALAGAAIGIGKVFSSLIHSVARNPSLAKQSFGYAILGFALFAKFGIADLFLTQFALCLTRRTFSFFLLKTGLNALIASAISYLLGSGILVTPFFGVANMVLLIYISLLTGEPAWMMPPAGDFEDSVKCHASGSDTEPSDGEVAVPTSLAENDASTSSEDEDHERFLSSPVKSGELKTYQDIAIETFLNRFRDDNFQRDWDMDIAKKEIPRADFLHAFRLEARNFPPINLTQKDCIQIMDNLRVEPWPSDYDRTSIYYRIEVLMEKYRRPNRD